MNYIYFDESKHPHQGFVLGAYVFSNEPLECFVTEALLSCGYNPDADEFKSSLKKRGDSKSLSLREKIYDILKICKIAVLIVPYIDHQKLLPNEIIKGLHTFISNNNISGVNNFYVDEGIFNSLNFNSADNFNFNLNSQSHVVKGIQIADLAAHYCSTTLKAVMSGTGKTVSIKGRYPVDEVDLRFEIFLRLRWSFFLGEMLDESGLYKNNGLYVSGGCNSNLTDFSFKAFGQVYLGCTM
jgi:hypothetical protein